MIQKQQRQYQREVRWYDWETGWRQGEIEDRNGNLLYVRDQDGKAEWVGHFEVESGR